MGNEERQKRYEGYIEEVAPMAAAIGRRVPYHLEYLRRHKASAPAEGSGPGQKGDGKMIAVICDRCGAQVPASGRIGHVEMGFRDGLEGGYTGMDAMEGMHYCQECMLDIKGYIEKGPGRAEGGCPGPKAGTGMKRVDAGKVMALKEAGWNAKKIAEDMGISMQSVYKVLHDHESGMQ